MQKDMKITKGCGKHRGSLIKGCKCGNKNERGLIRNPRSNDRIRVLQKRMVPGVFFMPHRYIGQEKCQLPFVFGEFDCALSDYSNIEKLNRV